MPSLLIIVFVLQLAIHLVNTVGTAAINDLLWSLYNLFPTPTSKSAAEQKELKKQYFKLKQDLNATSSQDEFAKWAKLRRQHDKVLEQYEKSKTKLDSSKSAFDTSVSALRWVGTNGLRGYLQFMYAKQPMFWIPQGFVPYYAEWLLSMPRAPLGSISIQIWAIACTVIIKYASAALVAVVALVFSGNGSAQKGKPMKVSGEKAREQPSGSENTKKEL